MAHKTKTADLNPEENLVATTKSTSVSSRRQSPRLVRKAATAAEDKTKKQTPSPLASTSRQTDKANEISSSISSSRRGRKSASVVAEDDSKADHRGADPKNHLKKTGSKVPKAKEDPPAKPESVAAAAEEEEDAEKETTGAGGGDVDDTSASRKRNLEEEEEEEEGKTEKADAKQEKRPKQDPQPKITKRKIGPDHGDGGGGDDEVDANTDAKKGEMALFCMSSKTVCVNFASLSLQRNLPIPLRRRRRRRLRKARMRTVFPRSG